ncbi:uncharacterized protein BCR38DRAFT_452908 [Pseudomassariella vexata]|uniref:Uncharacterized protein n=1 Tax=Pseudomassariella vexata TaxID=1141098 RepID=A0A1Y2D757_9PEZI|nr:uncharacterized protein BCR38DRAFT_452908 [Pseudomassariella vexata]ORY55121.1 hypothetical protein BCR38DRAFT_452908 [Pseudomassariella vexata]
MRPGDMATTTMTSTTEKKRPRRPRRNHIVPESGSLYDVMHEHQGLSLFVLPICWTDLHTRLLGCRFVQLPPQNTPTPSSSNSPRRSPARTSPTVVEIGRYLDTLMTTETSRNIMMKNRALRNIMMTLFPDHLSKPKAGLAELDLRFGGRLYQKAVRCQVLWKHPDACLSFDSATTWTSSRSTNQLLASMNVTVAANDAPILAYVSRSNLDCIRNNCFRIAPGPMKSYNGPVHQLQKLRSKHLIPSNPDEDQYFIAAMIAMAQKTVYADGLRSNIISPRDVKVRLFTVSEEENTFLVYTATVPAAFLMMFHEPHKAPQENAKFDIEFTSVPVWPVLGLKERLGKALGEEVVGGFDELNIETYDEEEEEELTSIPQVTTSPKRRREALSEVLNASFSEDSNCDDPLGKRRCLEGRVGVVR